MARWSRRKSRCSAIVSISVTARLGSNLARLPELAGYTVFVPRCVLPSRKNGREKKGAAAAFHPGRYLPFGTSPTISSKGYC